MMHAFRIVNPEISNGTRSEADVRAKSSMSGTFPSRYRLSRLGMFFSADISTDIDGILDDDSRMRVVRLGSLAAATDNSQTRSQL